MPFGYNCEYETFEECLADQVQRGHSADEARRICGALQRDTEEECRRQSSGSMTLEAKHGEYNENLLR